jgi:hypothetical protein
MKKFAMFICVSHVDIKLIISWKAFLCTYIYDVYALLHKPISLLSICVKNMNLQRQAKAVIMIVLKEK